MYQILPLPVIVGTATWLACTLLLVVLRVFEPFDAIQIVATTVSGLLLIVTLKPVWRFFWRWIPWLQDWFPDLNGDYDVELRHNWPIQERLLKAAVGGTKFDPRSPKTKLPTLAVTKLRATINVGFYSIYVDMWAEDPHKPKTVIERSRSLLCSLKRPCDGHPHRLVYVYQQKNQRDRIKPTDDSTFEGAAVLDIHSSCKLNGEYWTNRAWHQGLSTAGQIVFTRRT